MCQDIVKLRRSDHQAARQNAAGQKQEVEKEKWESEIVSRFRDWVAIPNVRDWICMDWLNPEEREQEYYKLYGYEGPPIAPVIIGSDPTTFPPLENIEL
jgi:hypothetical protein